MAADSVSVVGKAVAHKRTSHSCFCPWLGASLGTPLGLLPVEPLCPCLEGQRALPGSYSSLAEVSGSFLSRMILSSSHQPAQGLSRRELSVLMPYLGCGKGDVSRHLGQIGAGTSL